jgi:hypothetical protein
MSAPSLPRDYAGVVNKLNHLKETGNHGDRADATGGFRRAAQLGLRRRAALRADSAYGRPEDLKALCRRRTTPG